MKEWIIHLPVEGTIVTKIVAENEQQALDILYNKQEQFLYHPSGILHPVSENLIMYTTNNKKTLN